MPFQSVVNTQMAPGVLGDFCDLNPRATVDASGGAFVAGPQGVSVGLFAWADPASQQVVNNFGSGAPTGFVHREQQALITVFLAEYSLVIPAGEPVTLFSAGGFFVKNAGTNDVSVGMKAYANYASGAINFAATGNPIVGASGSASTISAQSASFTGTIGTGGANSNVLIVTSVASGTIVSGAYITTGAQSLTQIDQQLTGTTGGIGTYTVTVPQYVASTGMVVSYGLMTVGGTVTGVFAAGDLLSGTGVQGGTYITAIGTGTGGAGTYYVNNNAVVGSTTISANSNVETKWFSMSSGAPGELIKMSSWALG